jgi:hypothetical protein
MLKETSNIANEHKPGQDTSIIEYTMLASSPGDPISFDEAAYGPQKDIWMLAMLEELEHM